MIATAFCLNRDYELSTKFVYSDINFVDLDLPDLAYLCAQMILKRICSYAQEDINKTIITDFRQQRLFITKCIASNNLWRRIRNLYRKKAFIWNNRM